MLSQFYTEQKCSDSSETGFHIKAKLNLVIIELVSMRSIKNISKISTQEPDYYNIEGSWIGH